MMRWNSTKTYTEDDILRMQQEAVMRVHEFQSRAKTLPFYDVPESAITPYQEPALEAAYEAPQEALPEAEPQQEVPQSAPQEEPAYPQPEPQYAPPTPMNVSGNQMGAQAPSDPITGILSKLNLDGETLLILGLMFLLYNEKADNVLLIALAYLLL